MPKYITTTVQQSQAEIQHLAHRDPLTNLPSRLHREKIFSQSLIACEHTQQELALLFIDLDNFKPVNNALEHAAVDLLLEQITKRLSKVLFLNQHLIRFGGDEFLLLTPFNDDRGQLDKLAEILIQQCACVSEFEIFQNHVVISASLGIACAQKNGTDFKQLCRKTDSAMYQAKQDDRNIYHYYHKSLEKMSDDKFTLLQLLRPAIVGKQFKLYYQPMIPDNE
jgi:diguanylate cyclase (GGDEF)-like protein